jgi:uncharacterized protein YqjF (DUF2071 family)
MNAALSAAPKIVAPSGELSRNARRRILTCAGEPLFLANWERTLMIHLEVDARELRRHVPFELDLYDGRAFVSLVAFTMTRMRPRFGGKITAAMFRPITTHDFLNVRTYVRHKDEPGIHFLAEWLSNWLAVQLGPRTFALPYHHGRINYQHDFAARQLRGTVKDLRTGNSFSYRATPELRTSFTPCSSGTLDEWLMERYTAFNHTRGRSRFFRIWHPPWPQVKVEAQIENDSLLVENWPWLKEARLIGANYSPGLFDVWMGRPQRLIRRSFAD